MLSAGIFIRRRNLPVFVALISFRLTCINAAIDRAVMLIDTSGGYHPGTCGPLWRFSHFGGNCRF